MSDFFGLPTPLDLYSPHDKLTPHPLLPLLDHLHPSHFSNRQPLFSYMHLLTRVIRFLLYSVILRPVQYHPGSPHLIHMTLSQSLSSLSPSVTPGSNQTVPQILSSIVVVSLILFRLFLRFLDSNRPDCALAFVTIRYDTRVAWCVD